MQRGIVKLIFTSANENHNKFYTMEDKGDGTFVVKYGRVGVTETTKDYPISQWETKYNEKVKKGYKDQTHLFVVASPTTSKKKTGFKDISAASIARIVNDLQRYANYSVQQNYTVTTEQVTQKQVDEAQKLLDELSAMAILNGRTEQFNKMLIDFFMVIPRRMKNVREEVLPWGVINDADKLTFVKNIVTREQDTLDVMAGQVNVNKVQKNMNDKDDDKQVTLLDAMGLSMTENTAAQVTMIKKMMGDISDKYLDSWGVINKKTQARFDKFLDASKNKKKDLFWHGSRNENWWNILDTGLVLRPTNAVITGKMFGYGSYFANKAGKSYGYTSGRGSYWAKGNSNVALMCLFDVHLGNFLEIKRHEYWCEQLTEKRLKDRGDYDSVFAKGGYDLRNDEIIVYKEEQSTVKYLVEVKG